MQEALGYAAARRDAWVQARLREVAPSLATVPEQVQRLLSNVQNMLAASSAIEAGRYASEVMRDAATAAMLHVEWKRFTAELMARAPLELSFETSTMCTAIARDLGTGNTLRCAMLVHPPGTDHVANGMAWRDGKAPRGFMGGRR